MVNILYSPASQFVHLISALILHTIHTHTHSQVLLKMVVFRLKYFTHKFEVFDGIVVVISWTLDVASMYIRY